METVAVKESRTERINKLVSILQKEQPDLLEEELKKLWLMSEAKKSDILSKLKKIKGSVIDNSLSMEEIVEECRIVRKQLYEEKQNRV